MSFKTETTEKVSGKGNVWKKLIDNLFQERNINVNWVEVGEYFPNGWYGSMVVPGGEEMRLWGAGGGSASKG